VPGRIGVQPLGDAYRGVIVDEAQDPPTHTLEARWADATGTVAELARELLRRCRELTLRATELERQSLRWVRDLVPTRLALPAAAGSPPPRSSAKWPGLCAAARRRRSPAGTEPHRSPSGPAMLVGIG